ncbi:MAG TPA: hypothetical protein VGJ21_19805 [Terracidiphilus sp.]|jgi:hypothetical protein
MATSAGGAHPHVEELRILLIVVGEKGRSACFRNPDRQVVRRIRVDGGLVRDGVRADFIVSKPAIVDVIVELKGSDTAHGVAQVEATRLIWGEHALAGKVFAALIVRTQGIHPRHQANIQRWKTRFQMRYGMVLLVETRNREYEFHEFVARKTNA